MRVTKDQILHGLTAFVSDEILPKLESDRAVQIIATVALNAVMANKTLLDAAFGSSMLQALLEDDGSGTYEIGGILSAMKAAVEQYGYFPVTIPAVPLLSPREISLRLSADDVDAVRLHIESA